MAKANFGQLVSFIFGIANDCLVDVYDVGDYRKIILPMIVLRRFDAVLEPTKQKVLAMKKNLDANGITDQDEALCAVAGEAFCNSSPYTLSDLKSRTNQQQLKADFILYLDGFSKNVQDIIKKFEFRNQIDKLSEHDILGLLISKFTDPSINLSSRPVTTAAGVTLPALDNHTMGTVFEEVIRKFNEETNITDAGRHFTPRDIVELITDLAFVPVKDQIKNTTYRIYDGACGTGGMLTVAEQRIRQVAAEQGKRVSIYLYGQENADETYAIAKSDMLLKGEGSQSNNLFFGSTEYWVILSSLLAAFVALLVVFRRRAIENANIVKQRSGRANKVAVKRLKQAHRLMQSGQSGAFYDEVMRALWGYVGDKLNMPVEQLSRENISQQLTSHQVDPEVIQQFISALDECEFARYAPGDATGNMNKVYDTALSALTQMASMMKKAVVMLALMLTMSVSVSAANATKAQADSLYTAERYQEAAQQYEALLKQGESADLYYNLGNAYYRMDDITHAVLAYERALLLSPGDADVRFNLQMARSKTIDKIVPESEMFFVTWYRSLVHLMSVDAWGRMAIVSLVCALLLVLVYLFAQRVWLRKVGFFAGLLFLVLFLASNVFGFQLQQSLLHRTGAIIIRSAVNVKSTPSQNGTDLFILHEGTRVNIIDDTMRGWREVRVADGKSGWVEIKDIEVI